MTADAERPIPEGIRHEVIPAAEWPIPTAIRRIQLAPGETLAVLFHEPIHPERGQQMAEQLADILGVESGRVVVLSGADDLAAISSDDEQAGA